MLKLLFDTFTKAQLAMMNDDDDRIEDAIEAWDALKREVGEIKAKQMFWQWAKLMPEIRADCDPDGDCEGD